MSKFNVSDAKGRIWNLEMRMDAAMRIDNSDFSAIYAEKFSILEPDRDFYMALLRRRGLLLAIVWAVVQPQAKQLFKAGQFPVDPEMEPESAEIEFASGFGGAELQEVQKKFWAALADFFPDHQIVLSLLREQFEKNQKEMNRRIQELIPDIENLMTEEIDKAVKMIKNQVKTEIQGFDSGKMSD